MKVDGYLVVNRGGVDTKFLQRAPKLVAGELAIPISIEIPNALFDPPKMPVVEITIDERGLPAIRAFSEHCEALRDAGVKIRLVAEKDGEG